MEQGTDGSLHRGPLYRNSPAGKDAERSDQEQADPSEDKPPSDVTAKAFKAVLDGENYQIGFVDAADTPYAETIKAAREIGAKMYEYHSAEK